MPATPGIAPKLKRLSEGTSVKAQPISVTARWTMVGVTKMRLDSSPPLTNPLAIETTTNIEPISVPAAAPSTTKKSCQCSSTSMTPSDPPGALRLAAIGGADRGNERAATLAFHQILDRPRRRTHIAPHIAAAPTTNMATPPRFGAKSLLHRLDTRRIFEAVPHDQNQDREQKQLAETHTEHCALILGLKIWGLEHHRPNRAQMSRSSMRVKRSPTMSPPSLPKNGTSRASEKRRRRSGSMARSRTFSPNMPRSTPRSSPMPSISPKPSAR